MDKKLRAETFALLLLFAAFPIISFGTTSASNLVWWIGLVILVLGGVLPVWTRFMDHSRDAVRDVGMEFDDRTS
ncbi:MAG TPA: EmrB/QacA subfamily drug resistance transporter [Rhizobiaceae bacterium]|nr:EmrB/QacA subfamily drug resistance transporter [Rhizobiaceae bacterium]